MKSVRDAVAAMAQPIGVLGFGVEGRETLRFLLAGGAAGVAVADAAFDAAAIATLARDHPGATFHSEAAASAALAACATLFRSPGVRPDHPLLAAARGRGARVTSATEFFLAHWPGPVVGVTGTVGKGTTATLVAEALRAAGLPHRLAGNIGLNPLAFLAEGRAGEIAVLELSSFQLMGLEGRRPEVAVVLRTTAEHQDWHRDVTEYRAAKGGLLAPTGVAQAVIHCVDSEGSREVAAPRLAEALGVSLLAPVVDGIGWDGQRLVRYRKGRTAGPVGLHAIALPGRFNLENAAAALLAAEMLGAEAAAAAGAIAAFPGLPHRLEWVGTPGGVACFNDSYATRPDAALGALSTFDAPLAAIMGGSEKFADFAPLGEALCRHPSLRALVLIGATAERLREEVEAAARRLGQEPPPMARAESLEAAFRAAREAVPPGGVVLFSPACASFDMFPNYKVRGERFKALVEDAARAEEA